MPQLPGYNIGNALLDFSPVSNALQSYQKNALAQQQMGMDQQRLDMDRQTHALQKQNMQRQWSQQDAEKAGSEAFAIHNMQGPAKGIAWQRYLKTYGDGNHTPEELDPNTGPAIAAAHAGKYIDGMKQQMMQAELAKTQAETKALGNKDAVSEYMMKMLAEPDQGAASPASPIQPQSFQGGPARPMLQNISNTPQQPQRDPNLIRVADETPAPEEQGNGPANPGAVYSMPGGEMVSTPFGQMTRDKARKVAAAVALKGNAALSKMLMDAATGGGGQLSKAATTQIDKDEIAATNSIATLDSIKQSYDAKYLNIPNRVKLWGKDLTAKFGALSQEDQADLKGYAQFRQSAWHNLNRVLKDLSGTAVTENEMQRQLLDLPNPGKGITDGDSPPDFEAKLNGAIKFQRSAIARARYLRSQGFTGKPWEAGIALEDVPGLIDKRGAEIENQLKQANPNADPMAIQKATRNAIKQEFGI